MDAFSRDLDAIQAMQEFARGLSPLCGALEDSPLLAGSEAYQGSLLFDHSVKNAVRAKDPGAARFAPGYAAAIRAR